MLFPFLTLFDVNSIRANFKKPIPLGKVRRRCRDFAILVPLFNDVKYLRNVDFLKQHANHVTICSTQHETPQFIAAVKRLCRRHGFRAMFSDVDQESRHPWSIYRRVLAAHDAVLKQSITAIKEKYVIFMDGDTTIDGDPARLTGAMAQYKFDLASVKVLPSRRRTVMEKLQGVEYDIAMQARLLYPWLTSGAGMVARREIMQVVMRNHSLFFNGGDIEIGKLADLMGYRIGHLPMTFYTDVPPTFYAWMRQRFSWMCGCFRHAVVNADYSLRHPFHFAYFTFIMYFLLPLKLHDIADHVSFIPLLLAGYAVLTYAANWRVRSAWMLVFPVYALFQITVLPWCGIWRYLVTVYKSRNVGRMRLRYHPDQRLAGRMSWHGLTVPRLAQTFVMFGLLTLATTDWAGAFVFGYAAEPLEYVFFAKDASVDLYQKIVVFLSAWYG